jgi:hypothetical protein
MKTSAMIGKLSTVVVQAACLAAYPQLRRWPAIQRADVLRRARAIELDPLERCGIVAAVLAACVLLEPLSASAAPSFARYIEQFILAVPLLLVLTAPFLIRRTRRGLLFEHSSKYGGEACTSKKLPELQARAPGRETR